MRTVSNLQLEYLDCTPFNTVDFNFSLAIKPFEEPKLIGLISIGYLRSGDMVGSQGNDDLTVWYQDGTKRTVNRSWFE